MQTENHFILKLLKSVCERCDWSSLLDRDQGKSPFSAAASICEMVWCQSITWMRAVCLWWTPAFQTYDEKNSVGLRKGGRKCGLLMLTLSTKVVSISSICYSSSFHSIPHHPFLLLSMSPCLVLFLSSCSTSSSLPHAPSPAPHLSKAAGRTLRSAKLLRLHKHRWNGWQWAHCSAGHLSSW